MQLNPYLSFNGQCEAAFRFYERCLGGKIIAMMTYGGTPMADQTPPAWRGKIVHARLKAGDHLLMGWATKTGQARRTIALAVLGVAEVMIWSRRKARPRAKRLSRRSAHLC